MKKIFLLITALLLAVSIFTGCENNDNQATNDIESYDNVSVYIPEASEDADTDASAALSGEMVVKDVRYTWTKGDIAVITVENGTNKNYSVTVKCVFSDKDGNTLKTQAQTFDQYSAGYTNNFIFVPEVEFESYTYTIETKEAEGPFYAKHVTSAFRGLEMIDGYIMSECEKGNWETYPSVVGFFSFGYDCETTVKSYSRWLLVNEQNVAVYWEDYIAWLDYGQVAGEGWGMTYVYQTTDRSYQMPKEWQENIKAIVSITALTTEPKPAPPSSTN